MNMQALMQQAQRMQREMEKAQKDLEAKEFEIISAGGGIKIIITGAKVVKNIEIDEDIIERINSYRLLKAHSYAN